MKILLLLILATSVIAQRTKADTIDYWNVYYNKIKIEELSQFGNREITIKIDKIKSSDSITVIYFKDTRCTDCDTHLTIKDEKHHTVVICKGKGEGVGNPLSFALKDLLAYKQRNGSNSFEIFYDDIPIAIFNIKFG